MSPDHLRRWLVFIYRIILANLGLLRSPFRIFLVVTKSCNSRCSNCLIWTEKSKNEMSLAEIEKIAMANPDLSWLNISGGEPTERSELVQIVRTFYEHCRDLLAVNFTTNGIKPSVISEIAEKIAALNLPVFNINVSLDGPEEVHDRLRGIKGNFESAIATIKSLRLLRGVQVRVAMTLYGENADLVAETISAVQARIPTIKESDFHFNFPHQSEHFYGNSKQKNKFNELTVRYRHFDRTFVSWFRASGFIENAYRSLLPQYIKTKQSPVSCSALMTSMYISENGEVYPCTIWNLNLGRLADYNYNLSALNASPHAKKAALQIKKNKCPGCWTPCEAYPSIISNFGKTIAGLLRS